MGQNAGRSVFPLHPHHPVPVVKAQLGIAPGRSKVTGHDGPIRRRIQAPVKGDIPLILRPVFGRIPDEVALVLAAKAYPERLRRPSAIINDRIVDRLDLPAPVRQGKDAGQLARPRIHQGKQAGHLRPCARRAQHAHAGPLRLHRGSSLRRHPVRAGCFLLGLRRCHHQAQQQQQRQPASMHVKFLLAVFYHRTAKEPACLPLLLM